MWQCLQGPWGVRVGAPQSALQAVPRLPGAWLRAAGILLDEAGNVVVTLPSPRQKRLLQALRPPHVHQAWTPRGRWERGHFSGLGKQDTGFRDRVVTGMG